MPLLQGGSTGGGRDPVVVALLLVAILCLVSACWLARLGPSAAATQAAEAERETLRAQAAALERRQKVPEGPLAGLAADLAQVWRVPQGTTAQVLVVATFQSVLRSAQVEADTQIGAPRVDKVLDLPHVQTVEFDVSISASMRVLSRLFAEMEKTTPPFSWRKCAIRPTNLRDPRTVRLQGRLGAWAIADDAVEGALAAIAALPPPTASPPLSADQLEPLWKCSLFRPERSEEPGDAPTEEVSGTGAPAFEEVDMELAGVATIGEESVATILTTVRRRREPSPAAVQAGPRKAGHLYRVGDAVGETGYVVKAIGFEAAADGQTRPVGRVVLVRGNEERFVVMELGDAQSARRRQEGAQEQSRRLPAVPRATTAPAAAGPPPRPAAAPATAPPPPPAPAASSPSAGASTPAPQMTREGRLERARQLRERIMQGRASPAPPSN